MEENHGPECTREGRHGVLGFGSMTLRSGLRGSCWDGWVRRPTVPVTGDSHPAGPGPCQFLYDSFSEEECASEGKLRPFINIAEWIN